MKLYYTLYNNNSLIGFKQKFHTTHLKCISTTNHVGKKAKCP